MTNLNHSFTLLVRTWANSTNYGEIIFSSLLSLNNYLYDIYVLFVGGYKMVASASSSSFTPVADQSDDDRGIEFEVSCKILTVCSLMH